MFSGKRQGSLAMEGLDVINVPENGFLLAGDIRRYIRAVHMLQVVGGEEINLSDKLWFAIYQVLNQLAWDMK